MDVDRRCAFCWTNDGKPADNHYAVKEIGVGCRRRLETQPAAACLADYLEQPLSAAPGGHPKAACHILSYVHMLPCTHLAYEIAIWENYSSGLCTGTDLILREGILLPSVIEVSVSYAKAPPSPPIVAMRAPRGVDLQRFWLRGSILHRILVSVSIPLISLFRILSPLQKSLRR